MTSRAAVCNLLLKKAVAGLLHFAHWLHAGIHRQLRYALSCIQAQRAHAYIFSRVVVAARLLSVSYCSEITGLQNHPSLHGALPRRPLRYSRTCRSHRLTPLRALGARSYRRAPAAVPVERLWFCIWLPHLPLEANRSSEAATAVVEEQHGIHRILLADTEASAAGVMPGQAANAALALLPTLLLEERSLLGEQQALEGLATWLERFSSFVCIADRDVLLLEIAGSLRLFGGLQELRRKISRELRALGFTASLSIAPTPLAATWLARSGRRACIRDATNLAPVLRRLPLACLSWPAGLCETLTGMGVSTVG